MNACSSIINRLNRLPIWPYSPLVLFSVGSGFFFAFFDMVSIGLALPKIEEAFHVSSQTATWAITSSLLGYILGSFLDSRLSDRCGRQTGLYISIFLFSVGSIFCAFSGSINGLIFWRFVSGMGLGAEIAIVTTLMGELSPAGCRGQYTSRAIAFGMLGFAVVPFIGLLLVPNFTWGWRALFVFSGFGGVVIAFTRWWVPESPHWLIANGFIEKADQVVLQAEEFTRSRLQAELPPIVNTEHDSTEHCSFSQLSRSSYGPRLFLFVVIWFVYYLGNYAWLTLTTSLLVDKGFKLANSIGFVTISSCGFLIGSLFPILWGDTVKRKLFSTVVAIIWSIALLVIGWFPTIWVIIVFGFIAAMTIAAIIPIMYTYTAENFPTNIRATCVSITDGLGHLGGAICGQVVFGVFAVFKPMGLGFSAALTSMALTGVLTAWLLYYGKEMTKKSL